MAAGGCASAAPRCRWSCSSRTFSAKTRGLRDDSHRKGKMSSSGFPGHDDPALVDVVVRRKPGDKTQRAEAIIDRSGRKGGTCL